MSTELRESAYRVELFDDDCGNTLEGNSFIEYGISDDRGIIQVRVRAEYDDSGTSYRVFGDTGMLIGIVNELHLLACLTTTIHHAFSDAHEFYSDVFYDEGKRTTLPMLLV